MIIAYAEL